jgi:hypothetical protein
MSRPWRWWEQLKFFPRDLTLKKNQISSTKYLLKEIEKTDDNDDNKDEDVNTTKKQIDHPLLVFSSRPNTISASVPPLFYFLNWIIFLDYKHTRQLRRHDI